MRVNKKIQIFIYTDSQSLITIATKNFILTSKTAMDNDSDIKCEIRHTYNQIKKYVSLQFVPSHQDDKKPFKQLSMASKLNVLMDRFAKQALDPNSKPNIRHHNMIPHLPHQMISYRNSYYRLIRDTLNHLNRYAVGLPVEKYIQNKFDLTDHQMRSIAWGDIANVLRGVSISNRTHFIKIFHHKWPTMARNKRWKQSDTDRCPLCQQFSEDSMHVYQCQDSRAKTCRSLQINELKKKLKGISTDPFIINHITRMIFQFSSNFPVPFINTNSNTSAEMYTKASAINNQIAMGVQSLFSGYLLTDLSKVQENYMGTLPLQRKPNIRSWNRNVIKFMFEYSQVIWKARSEILHNEAQVTQEALLREQAVSLLVSLRTVPYKIPASVRNLLNRSTHYLRTTPLQNVALWTQRVNLALEDQSYIEKTTTSDIRTWMYTGNIATKHQYTRLKSDDSWYDTHAYDSDYSDLTISYTQKFPDEAYNSWIPNTIYTGNTHPVNNNLIAPK